MCGCATHPPEPAAQPRESISDGLIFRVADMTCGHCAGAIARAVESALPGTLVEADPVSKRVSVRGSADRDAIKAIIAGAGYTPAEQSN